MIRNIVNRTRCRRPTRVCFVASEFPGRVKARPAFPQCSSRRGDDGHNRISEDTHRSFGRTPAAREALSCESFKLPRCSAERRSKTRSPRFACRLALSGSWPHPKIRRWEVHVVHPFRSTSSRVRHPSGPWRSDGRHAAALVSLTVRPSVSLLETLRLVPKTSFGKC